MKNPKDKVYRIKNRVDKDKALGIKSPAAFKEVVRKCPFRFNPSGYL